MHRLFVVVLVACALVLGNNSAVKAQEAVPGADPSLGAAVPYIGPEGDELATVTITDLVDPFSDYDPNSSPERGNHYVLLNLTIDNTGQRPLQVDPGAVVLQDTDGFLYSSGFVSRAGDAEDTSLQFQELPAGASVKGDLAFTVFNNVELVRVLFRPESDRLIVLADLRQSDDVTSEPAAEATAEPTVTTEPLPPSVEATAEPTVSTEPPSAETPAATVSAADCEGLDTWLAATQGRVDRAVAIDDELTALGDPPDASARDTVRGFAAEFAVFAKQQREAAAPPVAAADNDTLVQTFADAAEALGALALGLETNDPVAASTNLTVYRANALVLLVAPSLLDQFAQDCGIDA